MVQGLPALFSYQSSLNCSNSSESSNLQVKIWLNFFTNGLEITQVVGHNLNNCEICDSLKGIGIEFQFDRNKKRAKLIEQFINNFFANKTTSREVYTNCLYNAGFCISALCVNELSLNFNWK